MKVILGILFLLSMVALVYFTTTIYMAWATAAYFVMIGGIIFRKNRSHHQKLMLLAISLDILLVLFLEVQRGAIETAASLKLEPLQQAHIYVSTLALILYFPTGYLGVRSLLSTHVSSRERLLHRRLGKVVFVLRSLGFLLMFSMLKSAADSF